MQAELAGERREMVAFVGDAIFLLCGSCSLPGIDDLPSVVANVHVVA